MLLFKRSYIPRGSDGSRAVLEVKDCTGSASWFSSGIVSDIHLSFQREVRVVKEAMQNMRLLKARNHPLANRKHVDRRDFHRLFHRQKRQLSINGNRRSTSVPQVKEVKDLRRRSIPHRRSKSLPGKKWNWASVPFIPS